MAGRNYLIHGDAGVAWFLVFDSDAGKWVVEKVEAGAPRSRTPLSDFEETPEARMLGKRLKDAIDQAAMDV